MAMNDPNQIKMNVANTTGNTGVVGPQPTGTPATGGNKQGKAPAMANTQQGAGANQQGGPPAPTGNPAAGASSNKGSNADIAPNTFNGSTPQQGGVPVPSAKPQGAPAGKAAKAPEAPPPATYQQAQNAQFGAGNPFGQRGNYSDPNNPIYAGAMRSLQQQLGEGRARFASQGLGTSGREALMEGNAMGNFGAQIGQLGEQAFQNDANRGLSSFLGAAQNQLGQNQLALQANSNLANLGTGLTGIGSSEQQMPGIAGVLQAILGMSGQDINSAFSQRGNGGWWT